MKHVDDGGPTYPPERVFVGLGSIYRIGGGHNGMSSTIQVLGRTVGGLDYVGKHRLHRVWPTGTRYFMASGNLRNHNGIGFGALVGSVDRPLDIGDTWG